MEATTTLFDNDSGVDSCSSNHHAPACPSRAPPHRLLTSPDSSIHFAPTTDTPTSGIRRKRAPTAGNDHPSTHRRRAGTSQAGNVYDTGEDDGQDVYLADNNVDSGHNNEAAVVGALHSVEAAAQPQVRMSSEDIFQALLPPHMLGLTVHTDVAEDPAAAKAPASASEQNAAAALASLFADTSSLPQVASMLSGSVTTTAATPTPPVPGRALAPLSVHRRAMQNLQRRGSSSNTWAAYPNPHWGNEALLSEEAGDADYETPVREDAVKYLNPFYARVVADDPLWHVIVSGDAPTKGDRKSFHYTVRRYARIQVWLYDLLNDTSKTLRDAEAIVSDKINKGIARRNGRLSAEERDAKRLPTNRKYHFAVRNGIVVAEDSGMTAPASRVVGGPLAAPAALAAPAPLDLSITPSPSPWSFTSTPTHSWDDAGSETPSAGLARQMDATLNPTHWNFGDAGAGTPLPFNDPAPTPRSVDTPSAGLSRHMGTALDPSQWGGEEEVGFQLPEPQALLQHQHVELSAPMMPPPSPLPQPPPSCAMEAIGMPRISILRTGHYMPAARIAWVPHTVSAALQDLVRSVLPESEASTNLQWSTHVLGGDRRSEFVKQERAERCYMLNEDMRNLGLLDTGMDHVLDAPPQPILDGVTEVYVID